jgi:hypothetical protein
MKNTDKGESSPRILRFSVANAPFPFVTAPEMSDVFRQRTKTTQSLVLMAPVLAQPIWSTQTPQELNPRRHVLRSYGRDLTSR